eukprot:4284738-Prymnesium_polylepis.1
MAPAVEPEEEKARKMLLGKPRRCCGLTADMGASHGMSLILKLELYNSRLTELPPGLASCKNLQHLDIGANPNISSLDGIEGLSQLRILFASGCEGLGPSLPVGGPLTQLPSLFMLAVKETGLTVLDGAALPNTLGWLIAAQNKISMIKNPGRLSGVRKLMLSHNEITTDEVDKLLLAIPGLEMLRIAGNRLQTLPAAVTTHPHLAWIAL